MSGSSARRRLAVCVAAGLIGSPPVFADRARSGDAVGAGKGGAAAPLETNADERSAAAAMKLVEAMAVALRTLNYEGTFVHLRGTHATSMLILHAFDAEGERERMVSLDGEAREVIRDHSLVTCIWPGSSSVVVSKAKPRKLLPNVDAILAGNPSYAFALGGTDRVAGIVTDVVEILPRDDFRYGYRFWVDRETRMLLRSMLLDGDRILEQVLFTAIEYPRSIALSRFAVDVDQARMSWIDDARERPTSARATAGDLGVPTLSGDGQSDGGSFAELESRIAADGVAGSGPDEAAPAEDRVRFETLPMGYAELSESVGTMPPGDASVSHVMLSDGMASVSVYVEHLPAAAQDTSVVGLSSMGAMNAFGLSLEHAFVTAVGEVPADTVRSIAQAVRLVE